MIAIGLDMLGGELFKLIFILISSPEMFSNSIKPFFVKLITIHILTLLRLFLLYKEIDFHENLRLPNHTNKSPSHTPISLRHLSLIAGISSV